MGNKPNIAFLVDGSFLPIRNGNAYSVYHLMNALAKTGKVTPNLLISYRGWESPELYYNQAFKTIFLSAEDRYKYQHHLDYALLFYGIDFLHIYNAEEVVDLAPRLKELGVKIVHEVANVEHVLYDRLGLPGSVVKKGRHAQAEAAVLADYILCRSEVDKNHLIALGAPTDKISVYRGAIDTSKIRFSHRRKQRFKVVFLGHMYYTPNENALKKLADIVLPALKKIDPRYTLTVIGSTPPELEKKYGKKGVIFKGGVDSLSSELLQYDVAVSPLYEASGTRLKLLDFLASGLPVVSTTLAVEGLHAAVSDCLIIEDDIMQYARQVHRIHSSPNHYATMVEKGRQYVESYYNWHNNLGPFLEIYGKNATEPTGKRIRKSL